MEMLSSLTSYNFVNFDPLACRRGRAGKTVHPFFLQFFSFWPLLMLFISKFFLYLSFINKMDKIVKFHINHSPPLQVICINSDTHNRPNFSHIFLPPVSNKLRSAVSRFFHQLVPLPKSFSFYPSRNYFLFNPGQRSSNSHFKESLCSIDPVMSYW